jgi:regulator of RNase E activity RraB
VSHWAYFKSTEDRSKFIAKAINMGFKNTYEYATEKVGDGLPYGVTIERNDRVDWSSINEVTLPLFRLAREFDGDYDGWETSVEKEDG